MLHLVPHSTERTRLLEVVEMQRQLIEALCVLPQGAVVNQTWLYSVWPILPPAWIDRFWKNGKRGTWVSTIAASSSAEKSLLQKMLNEQLQFADLYQNPPSIRLTKYQWDSVVMKAVKALLTSFYDPLFYKEEGYPNATASLFNKDLFIDGFKPPVYVCPYTDSRFQDTKLDHFLPKDQFPMLSCHPDNLIPCSTDPNSGSHKGTEIPLDTDKLDQAGAWFHPRFRPAAETFRLEFPPVTAPQPSVTFVALTAVDQPRVDNMERMFGLAAFWGKYLHVEIQGLASIVQHWLMEEGVQPSEANIKIQILKLASQERDQIGRGDLAIVKSFFYEHIARNPILLAQIVPR